MQVSLALILAVLAVGCGGSDYSGTVIGTRVPDDAPFITTVTDTATITITPGNSSAIDRITSVTAIPSDIRVRPGESQRISARGLGRFGQPISGLNFRWELLDNQVGTIKYVESSGSTIEFTAGDLALTFPDAIRLTASQITEGDTSEVEALVPVEVVPAEGAPTLLSVESVFGDVLAATGQLIRLQGVAYDPLGRIVPAARVDWQLINPAFGRVIASNLLDVEASPGVYPNALRLRATLGDVAVQTYVDLQILETVTLRDRVQAFVLPSSIILSPGEEVQFEGIVVDGAGEAVTATRRTWLVNDPDAGTISSSGRFTAGNTEEFFPAAVSLLADVEGRPQLRATVNVSVRRVDSPLLASADVRPASVVVGLGQTSRFTLTVRDPQGRAIPNAQIGWRVESPTAGTIDSTGLFRASGGPGFYPRAIRGTVVQEIDGQRRELNAFADVTIAGIVEQVIVVPDQIEIPAGSAFPFRAIALDKAGFTIPGLIFTWSLEDPNAGSVDVTGVFRAGPTPSTYEDGLKVTVSQTIE